MTTPLIRADFQSSPVDPPAGVARPLTSIACSSPPLLCAQPRVRRRCHRGRRSLAAHQRRSAVFRALAGSHDDGIDESETEEFFHNKSEHLGIAASRSFPRDAPVLSPPVHEYSLLDRGLDHPSGHAPPAHTSGEPLVAGLATESFTFLFLNIQGLVSHEAELSALLEQSNYPTFLGLNETFLPGEGIVKNFDVQGYVKVSRLDRRDGSGWGGILLYAKQGYEDFIVHVGDSPTAERSWHILHTDRGPVSVVLWYRPPNRGEVGSILTLIPEIDEFARDVSGHIIIGDLNVHEASWLRYSDGTSIEGRELHEFCRERGLDERVRAPTRGNNLLDLVLTDLGALVRAKVVPGLSDHEAVLCVFEFPLPEVKPQRREVFEYSKARWSEMCDDLSGCDWPTLIRNDDADGSAQRFTSLLLHTAKKYIPQKWITDSSGTHPWLDDECRRLIQAKRAARGTDSFVLRRDECSRGLAEAYNKYVVKTRQELKKLGPSTKGWWRIAKRLMSAASTRESIPPLRQGDGSWAKSSTEKAELFAEVFATKSQLDAAESNEFSVIEPLDDVSMDGFLPVRVRYARSVLKDLKENSGTGPDLLAAKILKRCRAVLELPIILLTRAILASSRWPQLWRQHWIHPLYKKSRADAGNYRGIHLTPQLSKVVERIIGKVFLPWVHRHSKFGDHQYAYGPGRSHKDALLVNICSWLLRLEEGDIVALYCSDVSGAFDRVRTRRLLDKLAVSGLHPLILSFLASWLDIRSSVVVVNGVSSIPRILANSVYQGTVLGSPLWNLFYFDAFRAVRRLDFVDVVFADDFNAWKVFPGGTALDHMLDECKACQASLHDWGRANSVKFDAGKESFHILHRSRSLGDDFLLLGVLFDCELRMHSAASRVAREAGWRLQAILRPQRFFREWETVSLYKALVLSYIESGMVAYFHAAPSVLHPIDRVQRRLVRELGLSELEALEKYRLAPLPTRRDIGMLGLLHRISLGKAPGQVTELFPKAAPIAPRFGPQTRLHRTVQRHNRQFVERSGHTDIFGRSLFGLVSSYNLLPQSIVDSTCVSAFQGRLQRAVLKAAKNGVDNWTSLLSGHVIRRQVEFQQLFAD